MNKKELLCELLQIIFEADNNLNSFENLIKDLKVIAQKISLEIKEEKKTGDT